MALFYLVWDEDDGPASVLIDAPSAALAGKRGSEEYGEKCPSRVCPIPANVLMLQADEDDDGQITLVPPEHVLDLLEGYEDEDGEADAPVTVFCVSEAEGDGGEVLHCSLAPNHLTPHRSTDGSEWE